jgi:dihydrofolate reductase
MDGTAPWTQEVGATATTASHSAARTTLSSTRSGYEPGCTVAREKSAGLLTFALNVTLDGCCDHREMIADEEMHKHFTKIVGAAGAMLYGRTTYELMEGYWPGVARSPQAPRAMREWARTLEEMPKHVVSASRHDFPWNNSFHVKGDLREAVMHLKERTPNGVLVGSPKLSATLEQLGLIDEYHFLLNPVLAGHPPHLFHGLESSRPLDLVSVTPLRSGLVAMHYRRNER